VVKSKKDCRRGGRKASATKQPDARGQGLRRGLLTLDRRERERPVGATTGKKSGPGALKSNAANWEGGGRTSNKIKIIGRKGRDCNYAGGWGRIGAHGELA